MAGEEAVKGASERLRRWQMETYPRNEEEQKQETPQRKGGKVGKTREGGEDSKAVRDVVKKIKKILCIFTGELKTIIDRVSQGTKD